MYTPDLRVDYKQYLITCALRHSDALPFPEWLTRRTDERIYEDRIYKQQPEAFKKTVLSGE